MLANAEQNGAKLILPVSLSITHPYDTYFYSDSNQTQGSCVVPLTLRFCNCFKLNIEQAQW